MNCFATTFRFVPRSLIFTLLLIGLIACLSACATDQPTHHSATGSTDGAFAGWTICLDAYQGPNHQAYAQQRAQQLAGTSGLSGFWVNESPNKSDVNFGKYDDADSAAAKRDLARLKAMTMSGRIQPRTLALVPALPPASGPYAQWELRQAREQGAVYTLVVERFTPEFGSGFRKQAEADCAALRAEGAKAFYYHGLHESVVTVEQFTHAAAKIATSGPNAGQPVYHPYIRDTLQKQFPYVKLNGKIPPQNPMPTFLIRIPE